MSFRLRLTLITAAAIAVTVTGTSLAVWLIAEHELLSPVNAALYRRAAEVKFGHQQFGFGDDPSTFFTVLGPAGGALAGAPLPIDARERTVAAGKQNGYVTDVTYFGTPYRILVAPLQNGSGAVVVARSLADTNHALARIRLWIFLIGSSGIALAAALAAFVAAAALRPIRRLTAAAESVAATGNLAERVEAKGDDELGRLAARFNAMLAVLEQSVGAQRRLVADASHELRTPLTAVRTNIDLLREGKLSDREAQRALAEASTELDALTHLVADLVELSRGEERKLRFEDVQLDDLVAGAVERAQSRAPQMTFVTALSPTTVQGDPVLLDRAVANLLDNAVKWSPAGSAIEVSVRAGEVVVADHGPGIDEHDLPHVFDRFYRAAAARATPGAGLGLAIVHEAATAHGGTATVENGGPGARFRLALPAS